MSIVGVVCGSISIGVLLWVGWETVGFIISKISESTVSSNQREITTDTVYKELFDIDKSETIDDKGYMRNGHGRLIHRIVAFACIYSYPEYPLRFREYQVHHKDRNKLNNDPDNLQIVTNEEHEKIHGI